MQTSGLKTNKTFFFFFLVWQNQADEHLLTAIQKQQKKRFVFLFRIFSPRLSEAYEPTILNSDLCCYGTGVHEKQKKETILEHNEARKKRGRRFRLPLDSPSEEVDMATPLTFMGDTRCSRLTP